jgi:hypothetical protein
MEPNLLVFESIYHGQLKHLAEQYELRNYERRAAEREEKVNARKGIVMSLQSQLKKRKKQAAKALKAPDYKTLSAGELAAAGFDCADLEQRIRDAIDELNALPEVPPPEDIEVSGPVGLGDWMPHVAANGTVRYYFYASPLPYVVDETDEVGGVFAVVEEAVAGEMNEPDEIQGLTEMVGLDPEAEFAAVQTRVLGDAEVTSPGEMTAPRRPARRAVPLPSTDGNGELPLRWDLDVSRIPNVLQQQDYRDRNRQYEGVFARFDRIMKLSQENQPGNIRYALGWFDGLRGILERRCENFNESAHMALGKCDWLEDKHAESFTLWGLASIFSLDGFTPAGVDESDESVYDGLSPFFVRTCRRSLDFARSLLRKVPGMPIREPAPAPRPRPKASGDDDDVPGGGFARRAHQAAPPPPPPPRERPPVLGQFDRWWDLKKQGAFVVEVDGEPRPCADSLDYWISTEVWEEYPDLAFFVLFIITRGCTSVDVERIFSKLRHLSGIYRSATLTERLMHEALSSMFPDLWRDIHYGKL